MAVVVRDVLYGDDSYYDGFDNGDEFIGNTPVFVIVEQHALYEIEDRTSSCRSRSSTWSWMTASSPNR